MKYQSVDSFLHSVSSDIDSWPEYSRAAAGTGDDYKLRLKEKIQFMHTISDYRAVVSTYKTQKQFAWWAVSEILTEVFAMNPPLMSKYRQDIIEQSYKLRPDKTTEYAYGRRWAEWNQILNTIEILSARQDSKRAVVDIFTPYDTDPTRKDVPCTLMYAFKIRDNKVHMSTFFRSHDFFAGLKYDYILSSFMCQLITMGINAKANLNLQPGNLNFYDDSLHIYMLKDKEIFEKFKKEAKIESTNNLKFDVMYTYGTLEELYDDMWRISKAEEASYWANFSASREKIDSIVNPTFRDFARVFYNRNLNYRHKTYGEPEIDFLSYETKCLLW